MARKLKPKPTKKTKPQKPAAHYSVNALSKLTGADRKTIDKAIVRASIKPAKTVNGRSQYRLEDVQAALAAKPDKNVKEELLLEQVREKRIKNDKAESLLILRAVVNGAIGRAFGEVCRLLDQKLENEFPAMCVGLDIPGIRTKGKQLNDSIRTEWRKLLETWPE